MVVPDQPGIMTVNPDGSTVENRAATPSKTHDVLDINSGSAPKAQASSDPKKTKRIPGTAAPIDVLRHDTGRPVQLAPYQDTDSHRPGPNGNSPAGRPEGIGPRTDHPSVPGHSAENPVPVPAPNAPMAAP